MAVRPIDLLSQLPQRAGAKPAGGAEASDSPSFGETLKKFLADVNELQLEANDQMQKMVAGEVENLHDVMVAVEKASISFELLLEIRNKILEAYQELMRMQV